MRQLLERWQPVLVKPNSKQAMFKGWQTPMAPNMLLKLAHDRRHNLGLLIPKNVLVVDVDGPGFDLHSPMAVKSPNGKHIYMRHEVENLRTLIKPSGLPIDLKATGYCVVPDSTVDGKRYEWMGEILPPEKLPLIPPELLNMCSNKRQVVSRIVPNALESAVQRVRAYIAKIEPTTCGTGSCHKRCFYVSNVLVVKFGLSPAQALPLLME